MSDATSSGAGMDGLIYFTRRDVAALLPDLVEQVDLAERTYRSMAQGRVELPPKPGVHPRPDAFIHAMPAYLADDDVAAVKWVSGFPANKALGIPYIAGLIIVNDAATGVPLAIMDAVEITAARTAAASGVCVRRWAPAGWRRAAILGCGEQGRYHAAVLRALEPDVEIAGYDPDPARVAAVPGGAVVAADAREAVEGADVVITAAPIVEHPDPPVAVDWLAERCLVLPIDFDASVQREAIESCDLLISDDLDQFEHYRGGGHFTGWPAPAASVGQAIDGAGSPARTVCCNLGVGALDAAFAQRVLLSADSLEQPTRLPR